MKLLHTLWKRSLQPAPPWVKKGLTSACWAAGISILLLLAFCPYRVNGTSMSPALANNDRVVVDRVTARFCSPKRGDIVVFRVRPYIGGASERTFIKRVIALPGETLEFRGGLVYINGEKLNEPYLKPGTSTAPRSAGAYQKIPPGRYWVMGDYRSGSHDSRDFGPIRHSDITGEVRLIIHTSRWSPIGK